MFFFFFVLGYISKCMYVELVVYYFSIIYYIWIYSALTFHDNVYAFATLFGQKSLFCNLYCKIIYRI